MNNNMIEEKDVWGFEVIIKYRYKDDPVTMTFLDDWAEEDKWVLPYLVEIANKHRMILEAET